MFAAARPPLRPSVRDAWIVAAVAAGAVLRLAGLRRQLLVDDELHAVHAALDLPLPQILVTYRLSDFCQPLAAFYRFMMDRGASLSEMEMRLPVLAASLATVALLPLLAEARIGRRAAVVFAGLLATSPLLVLYGRMLRSYAPAVLLAGAAVLVFFAWLERPRWTTGLAYAGLAATATWFHLGAATFVLAPFVFVLLEAAWRRPPRSSPPARLPVRPAVLGGLAAATAGLHLAFLVPAWPTLRPVIEAAHVEQGSRWAVLGPVLAMQAGTRWAAVAVAFWLLALGGLAWLLRHRRRWALYTLAVAAVHVAGLLALSPLGLGSPQILNRYLLVLTPLVLLWVAVGIEAVAGRAAGAVGRAAVPVLVIAGLLAAGPLVSERFRTSSFAHGHDMLSLFTLPATFPAAEVPPFYLDLAARPGAAAVIEFPHRSNTLVARSEYAYQAYHGRPVLGSAYEPRLHDPRLSLAGQVAPRFGDLLASGAGHLVVHLDPRAEEAAIDETRWMRVFPMPDAYWRGQSAAAADLARTLTAAWGPPDHASPRLRVWDLERLRARRRER